MQAILQPLRGPTLYTSTIWLAAAPRAFHFGYGTCRVHRIRSEKTKGCDIIPLRFWIHPFFFTIFGRKRSHGGPHLYMCDIVWQCGRFFSFFWQRHTKIIDDPSFLGRFQVSPRGGQHHERLSRSRSMPSMGRCTKKKDLVLSYGKAKSKEETNHVFVWWRAHILEIILKILVQLIQPS